jgi:hypothetical protein
MTITTKVTRRPFQRAPKEQPGVVRGKPADGAPATPGAVTPKSSAPIEGLTIGGEPRVHLLPPQVLARKKGKAVRRRLGLGVVGMLVLVAIAAGLAEVDSISAQSALVSAQAQTTSILQQQAKYGDVLKVKADSDSIISSQQAATTQEILWKGFISQFQKTLPSGAVIGTMTAMVDTPLGATPTTTTTTTPLQGVHVATVTASLTMKQSQISGWLNSLKSIKGFVDVTPNSVTKGDAGSYTVNVTLHLDSDALANRFTKAATK